MDKIKQKVDNFKLKNTLYDRMQKQIANCDRLEMTQDGLSKRLHSGSTPLSQKDEIWDDSRRVTAEREAVLDEIKFLRDALDGK